MAVTGLGMIKDPRTIPPLLAALNDSYWFVRSEAADALGQTQNPLVVKALLDAANDSDTTVQASVQSALLRLCLVPGVPADEFASRLDDSNPRIVLTAALCLSLRKDARSTPVLLKLLNSPDPTVQLTAIKGLGETGDLSVAPTLRQLLRNPDINMRGWAIIGLGRLQDTASLPDLKIIANDNQQPLSIQGAAAAAITNINRATPSPTPAHP